MKNSNEFSRPQSTKVVKYSRNQMIDPQETKPKNLPPIKKNVIQPRLNSSIKQDIKKMVNNDYRPKSDIVPSVSRDSTSPMSPKRNIELVGGWKKTISSTPITPKQRRVLDVVGQWSATSYSSPNSDRSEKSPKSPKPPKSPKSPNTRKSLFSYLTSPRNKKKDK